MRRIIVIKSSSFNLDIVISTKILNFEIARNAHSTDWINIQNFIREGTQEQVYSLIEVLDFQGWLIQREKRKSWVALIFLIKDGMSPIPDRIEYGCFQLSKCILCYVLADGWLSAFWIENRYICIIFYDNRRSWWQNCAGGQEPSHRFHFKDWTIESLGDIIESLENQGAWLIKNSINIHVGASEKNRAAQKRPSLPNAN